jgi:hypothetical protein
VKVRIVLPAASAMRISISLAGSFGFPGFSAFSPPALAFPAYGLAG